MGIQMCHQFEIYSYQLVYIKVFSFGGVDPPEMSVTFYQTFKES